MEFSPANNVVKLCIQGMDMEGKGLMAEASIAFMSAWNDATNDFERFLAAYYVARHQKTISDRLEWYKKSLHFAQQVNNDAVTGAFASLYKNIAQCYQELEDLDRAKEMSDLAAHAAANPSDKGPFYHGTKADMQVGDLLTPGRNSNYQQGLQMNHIYFTALGNGAGLAAALAAGDGPERVYIVEPTGEFENDPNVTDKKFPGNPSRSYRTPQPLKIIGELKDWERQTPAQIQQWRERLAASKGEIIN